MSATTAAPAPLPRATERGILFTLAAVQFTHIMDFMVMMPLGARLMRVLNMDPQQFSTLLAAYGFAAALTGFAGGFIMDRLDRKRALLWLYAGFAISTLACALAPNYPLLLAARIAAGACGGVASALVTAMVSDLIPPQRRGRAMGVVMSAFPLASILGVPVGLILVDNWEWHAPFFMLSVLSVPVWLIAWRFLPALPPSSQVASPLRQMAAILSQRIHIQGFLVTAALVFGGGCMIPFMSPTLVANAGVSENQLKYVYLFGGAATLFTTHFFGWMTDRFDKLHVLTGVTCVTVIIVLCLSRMGHLPLPLILLTTTLFFVSMSGRFTPASTLVANAVSTQYRGGFMSVNSAVQQAVTAIANLISGWFITKEISTGRLNGYPTVGWMAVTALVLTIYLAWQLRSLAPHAASPGHLAPAAS